MKAFLLALALLLFPATASATVVLQYNPTATTTSPQLGGGQGLHTGQPGSTFTITNTGYLVLQVAGSWSCTSPYLNYRQYTSIPYSGGGTIITTTTAQTTVVQNGVTYEVLTFSNKPTFSSADFYQADVGGSGGVCPTTLAVGTNFPDSTHASDTVACVSDNTSAASATAECFPAAPATNVLQMIFNWIFQ